MERTFDDRNRLIQLEKGRILYRQGEECSTMFLLYSVYDGAGERESVAPMLCAHIDRFIAKVESACRKPGVSAGEKKEEGLQ